MSRFYRYTKSLICIGLLAALSSCASTRNKDKEGPNKDETVGGNISSIIHS
ncbi:MAG TPA: hypothetical protein VGJ93_15855 [Desulfuromonadaceae bacterium]